MIADEKVGAKGVKVKCKKCAHIIIVKPATAEELKAEKFESNVGGFGGFNEPTQAMSADQLAALKDSSGEGNGGDLFGNDPFAASGDQAPVSDARFGGAAGFGGASPSFGGDAPSFGGNAPSFGGVASESSIFGGDTGFGQAPSFGNASAGSQVPADEPGSAFGANFGAGFGDSANAFAGGFGGANPSFGGHQSGETALDSLGADTSALAPSMRAPGEKEWYVAVDEAQIGPVDIAEIEQRWDALEVDEDTLAWKSGMQDWVPVAEIADLAYLVTERPQRKAALGAVVPSTTSGGSLGAIASTGLGPVSFGGETGGGGNRGGDVSWTPSAASALSSLVQDELTTSPAQPAAVPAPTPSDMGMPSFGASDLFGGASGGAAMAMPAPMPAADPFAGGGGGWSVPKPEAKSSGLKPIHLALAGMAVLLVGLVVVVVLVVLRPPVTVPGEPIRNPEPVGMLAANDPKPVPDPQPEKPVTESKVEDPGPGSSDDELGKGRRKRKGGSVNPSPAPSPTPPKVTPTKPPKGPADDIFKSAAKASLSKADIMSGVKNGMGAVKDCIQGARGKGELTPGKHTLVLKWTIKANGKVVDPSVIGPNYVLGTSLPACFARGMRTWTFPASQSDSPVKNFPFGPFNIH